MRIRLFIALAGLIMMVGSPAPAADKTGLITPAPTLSGVTQGEFMDWSCYEGFRPADGPSDPADTLWWTGNIEYHIFGGQSVNWTPDLPQMDGVILKIKYGLWNSPSVALEVYVNDNYVGTCYANLGYISPGPKYALANITNYIVAGPDLVEIRAVSGNEAVIGYVGAGVRAARRDLAGVRQVQSFATPFNLSPARPDPFNPTTTIAYALPSAQEVRLTVFDLMGRQVAVLVDGWREAGSHEVTFDGSHLASGVYIYRLRAGEFEATGKMVLMK